VLPSSIDNNTSGSSNNLSQQQDALPDSLTL